MPSDTLDGYHSLGDAYGMADYTPQSHRHLYRVATLADVAVGALLYNYGGECYRVHKEATTHLGREYVCELAPVPRTAHYTRGAWRRYETDPSRRLDAHSVIIEVRRVAVLWVRVAPWPQPLPVGRLRSFDWLFSSPWEHISGPATR